MVELDIVTKDGEQEFFKIQKNIENSPLSFMFSASLEKVKPYKTLWKFKFTPNLPEFYKLGFFLIGFGLLLPGKWSLIGFIPGTLMLFMYIFWSKTFYKIMFNYLAHRRGFTVWYP